jgi:hypothetical protein
MIKYKSAPWYVASRESLGLELYDEEASVQVWEATAFGFKGPFTVHTWIALKNAYQKQYKVYEKIGWSVFSRQTFVTKREDFPDHYWFGNKPKMILQIKGKKKIVLKVTITIIFIEYGKFK